MIYSGTSITDTLGKTLSVLIKGVSSFQRLFRTLLYVAETVDNVLINGGVPISEVCIRGSTVVVSSDQSKYRCIY